MTADVQCKLRVIACESVEWLRHIFAALQTPTPLLLLSDDTIETLLSYCILGDMRALATTCSALHRSVRHAIRSNGLVLTPCRTIGEPVNIRNPQVQKYGLSGAQLHSPRHAIRLESSSLLVAQKFASQKGGRQCLRLLEHVPAPLRACNATCSAACLQSCGSDFDNNMHLVPPPLLLKAHSPIALAATDCLTVCASLTGDVGSDAISDAGSQRGAGSQRIFVAEEGADERVEMRDATSGEVIVPASLLPVACIILAQ